MEKRKITCSTAILVIMVFMLPLFLPPKAYSQGYANPLPPKDYKGVIKLDIRDSKADWAPYLRKKAPEGSPNILFILRV